mgnify:CR=1 FL=1
MQNPIPVVSDRILFFILHIAKVAKFHNKGSDKICQTLKKAEFNLQYGIYNYMRNLSFHSISFDFFVEITKKKCTNETK